jgi:hypothetical protein
MHQAYENLTFCPQTRLKQQKKPGRQLTVRPGVDFSWIILLLRP